MGGRGRGLRERGVASVMGVAFAGVPRRGRGLRDGGVVSG